MRGFLLRFRPASGALKEALMKQGFALDWLLSGSRGNSMFGCLNKSYPGGGKTRTRLKLRLVKKQ